MSWDFGKSLRDFKGDRVNYAVIKDGYGHSFYGQDSVGLDFFGRKGFLGKDGFDKKEAKCCVDVSGGEVVECESLPTPIEALPTGAVVKVPAVLAELTIQFNVDATITLPEPAFEIKSIKKRIKVTQCTLLQNTNMLFIKGFVRKNIDYSTFKCGTEEGFCGDIRHCTVDVPFKCTTPVTFNGLSPLPVIFNTTQEFEYFKRQDVQGPEFSEKDELLAGDLTEFNQVSTEYFNEMPFCELISARIVEFDEHLDPQQPYKKKFPFEEKEFFRIQEKMVIFLTLKVLQNRQIAIPPLAGAEDNCE